MDLTDDTGTAGAGLPRRLLAGAANVLWFAAAVVVAVLLWPSSLGGCTTLTIVSGHSMEPTYYTGDLVVSRCGPVDVGDVIVYSPPDVGGARVIHRIVDGNAADGWIVQGDNNDFLDPWMPTEDQILGSSVLHLPHVGKVASILLSPMTWISLLVVALAVVIWPGKQDADAEDGDGSDDADGGPDGEPDDAADPEPADDRPALLDRVGVVTHQVAVAVSARLALARARVARAADAVRALRPSRDRSRRAVAHGLLACLVTIPLATNAVTAHAATLAVNGGSIGTFGIADRCTTDTIAGTNSTPTSGSATSVVVTVPASCAGLTGVLRLDGVPGADVAFTAAAGTTTVTIPGGYTAASVTGFALTLGSWGMTTSWSYTPPVVTPPAAGAVIRGNAQTVLTSVQWVTMPGYQVCARVDLTTTTSTATAWEVHLNVAQSPWNGVTSGYAIAADAQWAQLVSSTAVNGVIRIVGTNGNTEVKSNQTRSFTVCR